MVGDNAQGVPPCRVALAPDAQPAVSRPIVLGGVVGPVVDF